MTRISSLQGKTLSELIIKTSKYKSVALKDASALYGQDDALDESLPASKYQILLQLNRELGSGVFALASVGGDATQADYYLVSVLDKFSSVHLDLQTDRIHYQYGDSLRA